MSVAQAALDGCEAQDESPSTKQEDAGSAKVTSLLRLPTPSRNSIRLASKEQPSSAPSAPVAAAVAGGAESAKGPEPWQVASETSEPAQGAAQQSAYRERLRNRGQQAMQRSLVPRPAEGSTPLAMLPGQPAAHALGTVQMPPVAPPAHAPQLHPGQFTAWAGQGHGMQVSPMMNQQRPQPFPVPMMGCQSGDMMQYGGQSPMGAMAYGGQPIIPGGAYQQAQMLGSPPVLPDACYQQPAPAAAPYTVAAGSGELTPLAPGAPDGSPKSTGELMAVLMPQGFYMNKDELAMQLREANQFCHYED